jgi:hypothetical protein
VPQQNERAHASPHELRVDLAESCWRRSAGQLDKSIRRDNRECNTLGGRRASIRSGESPAEVVSIGDGLAPIFLAFHDIVCRKARNRSSALASCGEARRLVAASHLLTGFAVGRRLQIDRATARHQNDGQCQAVSLRWFTDKRIRFQCWFLRTLGTSPPTR